MPWNIFHAIKYIFPKYIFIYLILYIYIYIYIYIRIGSAGTKEINVIIILTNGVYTTRNPSWKMGRTKLSGILRYKYVI